MPVQARHSDVAYHLARARAERDVAYRSGNTPAADLHMRLSALHMHRALLLQAISRGPVGNVHPLPLRGIWQSALSPATSAQEASTI